MTYMFFLFLFSSTSTVRTDVFLGFVRMCGIRVELVLVLHLEKVRKVFWRCRKMNLMVITLRWLQKVFFFFFSSL